MTLFRSLDRYQLIKYSLQFSSNRFYFNERLPHQTAAKLSSPQGQRHTVINYNRYQVIDYQLYAITTQKPQSTGCPVMGAKIGCRTLTDTVLIIGRLCRIGYAYSKWSLSENVWLLLPNDFLTRNSYTNDCNQYCLL